jgi:hypothetical protein
MELDRWLDEGMPEPGSAAARDHARACPRCAAAIETAEAVERALSVHGVEPAHAPAGFSTRVMERVREVESIRVREVHEIPKPRWWFSLLSDPVSIVSVTLAFLVAGLWIWSPERVLGVAGRLGAPWLAWLARGGGIQVHPTVWLAILTAAGLLALWMVWVIARNLERAFILGMTRLGR